MTAKGIEFKSNIDGQEVKLRMKEETMDIERKCDAEYHLAYTQLMVKGIMPRATLEKFMVEKAIWTSDDENKLKELQSEIVKLQIKLEEAKTHDQGLTIAKAMGELRGQCLRLVEVKANVLSNSCESLADQIRRDSYIAFATVYADTGKPVFKDYHDFLRRAGDSEQVVLDARQVILEISTSTFNESLTGLPEVHYVKTVEKQILEETSKTIADNKLKADKKFAENVRDTLQQVAPHVEKFATVMKKSKKKAKQE